MGDSVQPVPQTGDDADFQRWKSQKASGLQPTGPIDLRTPPASPATHDDADFQAWKAKQPASLGGGRGGGGQPTVALPTPAGQIPPNIHAEFASGNLAKKNAEATARDYQDLANANASDAGTGTQQLGGLASFVRKIPFAQDMAATARAAVRREPFQQSLAEIKGAEQSAPAVVRTLNELTGGTIAGLATPGTPVQAGAMFGGLSAIPAEAHALGGAPVNLNDREAQRQGAMSAIAGAAKGALIGKAVEGATTLGRAKLGPTAGATDKDLRQAVKEGDEANFGQVAAEGHAAGGTSPAIQDALKNPYLADRANEIRREIAQINHGQPASDTDVLLQLRSELSQKQSPLIAKIANAQPGQNVALTGEQSRLIQSLKNGLVDAGSNARTVTKPPITEDLPAKSVSVAPDIREQVSGPLESTPFAMQPRTSTGQNRFTQSVGDEFPSAPTFEGRTEVPPPKGSAENSYGLRVAFEHPEVQGPATTGRPGFILRGRARPGVNVDLLGPTGYEPASDHELFSGGPPIQNRVGLRPYAEIPGGEASPAMRVQTAPAETVTEPAALPGLRNAVNESARLRQERGAFRTMLPAMRRIAGDRPTPINQIGKTDPESVRDAIDAMTTGQARAATGAPLAALKESPTLSANPLKAFGLPRTVGEVNRIAPYLRALDLKSGASSPFAPVNPAQLSDVLRSLGVTSATPASSPSSP